MTVLRRRQCDIVTVNCPLHEGTKGLVNEELLKSFKKGAWIVNTARGAICDKDAIAAAVSSGHINGYAGDVWNVQPAPKDHVWRTMKNPLGAGNGMVPHYSGTTLDAQARYAAGTKSIIENYFSGKEQEAQNIIVGKKGYETKACECCSCLPAKTAVDFTPYRRQAVIALHYYGTMYYLVLNHHAV